MTHESKKMKREKNTVQTMINIYCKDKHKSQNKLCHECNELLDYTMNRLDKCPFQEEKPFCSKCDIHCYLESMKEKIKQVMKYSGPRMIYKHPLKTLFHYLNL